MVADVAKVLLESGSSPMGAIIKASEESAQNVKKCLVTLIKHNFVTFETNPKGFVEYDIDVDEVLSLLRYPKYIYVSKILLGDEAEIMVEELLKHGVMAMSQLIQLAANRLAQVMEPQKCRSLAKDLYDICSQLVSMHFIRCHRILKDSKANYTIVKSKVESTSEASEDTEAYKLPVINLKLIKVNDNGPQIKPDPDSEEPAKKRRKISSDSKDKQNDLDIYWKVNKKRFDQYLRDQAIVEAVRNHYDDPIAGELARIILRLSEVKCHSMSPTTAHISKQDIIREAIKAKVCSDGLQVEQYLMCFHEDLNYRFIIKTEDRNEGMYSVNIFYTLEKLVENCLANIIQNRFCSKSARIYRLLMAKKYLQQKQIEDTAMIPAKEARQMTYNLYMNGLLKLVQCPKTSDYAPSRTFFLFTVDLQEVSLHIVERCYQSVSNAITRRLFEVQQNKTLLEKKSFIDALISTLEQQQSVQDVDQQIQDLRDSFTAHDSELLNKVNRNVKKLEQSELQTDETIFLLNTWLRLTRVNHKDSERIDPKVMAKYD